MTLVQILTGVALLAIGIGAIFGSTELANWEDKFFQSGIDVLKGTAFWVGIVVLIIGIGIIGHGTYDTLKNH